jgi:translation elongation factor P/translation initiation factor 5A
MASLQISGYDKSKPGKQTVTVTMQGNGVFNKDGQSTTFTVTVAPVERVSIQKLPAATVFMQGDDFNPTGLLVRAEYENGAVPSETISAAQLTFSGYTKDRAGVQTLSADYYGKRASFDVRVAALTGIAVRTPPDNAQYFTGEDLDLAGLVVMGTWEGMGEKPVAVTQESLSSFDKNRAGKQDVFVTYQGKTTSFPVTIVAMQALSVSRPPARLNYENGENLDLTGLTVQGTRMGEASIELVDVSRLKISGYERFKGGNQTITVTLGGKSATFRVTVTPNPFVGTWRGTYTRKNSKGVVEETRSVTLVMAEDSWSVTIPKTGNMTGYDFTGTYTRDTDSGKHAKLLLKNGNSTFAPGAAEILSSTELKLSESRGEYFSSGLTLTR